MSSWKVWPEAFPEQSDTEYLVMLSGHFVRIAYYYRDSYGKHWGAPQNPWAHEWDEYVTHWMKLPKVPEGDTNER